MGQKRIEPSKTTQSKIYLRTPKKKNLKITSKTVEEAILIPAAKPKKSSIVKVLSAKTEVVAITRAQAGAAKITKRSGRPYTTDLEKSQPDRKTKSHPRSGVLSADETDDATRRKTGKPRSILPYDHQPMFEGGFRVVQGGLPELGKRR